MAKIHWDLECERAVAVIEDGAKLKDAILAISQELGDDTVWAVVSATGMLKGAVVGVYDESQTQPCPKYKIPSQPYVEAELLSMSGYIIGKENNVDIDEVAHLHVVLGKDDFSVVGGHLLLNCGGGEKTEVFNTLELVLLKTYAKGERNQGKLDLKNSNEIEI